MAITTHNGTIKYKDQNGDIHILYPTTQIQNVIGLNTVLSGKQSVLTAGDGIIIENGIIHVTDNLLESHVVEEDTYIKFPVIGDNNTIYVDTTTGRSYKWDSDQLRYICIGTDYNAIDLINGSFD